MTDRPLPPAELRALVARAHRDDAALRATVARLSPALWRACSALAGPAAAERLTVRTFELALAELRAGRRPAAPVGWLLGIARTLCGAEKPESDDTTANADWLRAALRGVPAVTREAFLLTAVAGFSYTDVAVAYDCPLETVRRRVAAGRGRVADAIEHSDLPFASDG